jgi:predicted ATP-dependent Lon-type protease
VTDSSGAVVPNASCTLTSGLTQAVVQATSGSGGIYRFENLQRGVYDLEVSAKGFQTVVQKGILLDINARLTVNITMRVGEEKQTVEVTGSAPALNFEDATVQGTVTPET